MNAEIKVDLKFQSQISSLIQLACRLGYETANPRGSVSQAGAGDEEGEVGQALDKLAIKE